MQTPKDKVEGSKGDGSGRSRRTGSSDVEPLIVPHEREQDRLPTLEDQLNAVGFGRFQLFVGLTTMLFVVGDGMEMAAVSMLSKSLLYEWGVGWKMLALLGSLVFAGYIVGNLWGGYCSDRFGRRWTLAAFGIVFLMGGFCSVVSYNFVVFAVSRFVTGIGIGAAAGSASSLMAECSPTMHRGKLTMMVTGLGTALGMALVAFSGIMCHEHLGGPEWWRIMLLSCILPTALGGVLLLYVPESPHWCLVNGREDECERLIKQLARENNMEEHLLQGGKVFYRPPVKGEEQQSWYSTFTGELRGPTTFIMIIFAASCFSFCGHTYIYPIILQREYGEDVTAEYYDMMWASVAQMVAVLVIASLIDNPTYGRRWTLQLVFWTSFVLAGSVPYFTDLWNFKAANVLLRSTLQVPQSLIWVYGGELLPTTHRAQGLALCNSIGRIAAMGAPVAATFCLSVRISIIMPASQVNASDEGISYLIMCISEMCVHMPCCSRPHTHYYACADRSSPLDGSRASSDVIACIVSQISISALFATYMIATFIGALSCSVFQRETCGEYLAGYSHEATEVGVTLDTPRRNATTSPFHDKFKLTTGGDLLERIPSVIGCAVCTVDGVDEDGGEKLSSGGEPRDRKEAPSKVSWEAADGETTPTRKRVPI